MHEKWIRVIRDGVNEYFLHWKEIEGKKGTREIRNGSGLSSM